MTKQPQWKRIANLGDVNPIEYGGYFVYQDRTRQYEEEAEILLTNEEDGEQSWQLYRFSLDRLQIVTDEETHKMYLISDAWDSSWAHPLSHYDEWFHKDLASIADAQGQTAADLRRWFCSANPLARANAYRAVGEYHGFENLDSYPVTFHKRSELPRRIRRYKK